jgi:hypothetical protein
VASANGIASTTAASNRRSARAFLAFLRARAIISGDASIPDTVPVGPNRRQPAKLSTGRFGTTCWYGRSRWAGSKLFDRSKLIWPASNPASPSSTWAAGREVSRFLRSSAWLSRGAREGPLAAAREIRRSRHVGTFPRRHRHSERSPHVGRKVQNGPHPTRTRSGRAVGAILPRSCGGKLSGEVFGAVG